MPRCQRCEEPVEWMPTGRFGKKVPVNPQTREEHICHDILIDFHKKIAEQSAWQTARGLWKYDSDKGATYKEEYDFWLTWRWTSLQQKQV